MSVRPLDLLDLPFLFRHRRDVLALDMGRALTCGNPFGARAMLSHLNPNRQLYTAISSQDGEILMGQVILKAEEPSARVTFLAPANGVDASALPLLEALTKQAGDWGALHLLAEVNEESHAYKILRLAGFAMYAWQRAWKLPHLTGRQEKSPWRQAEEIDWHAIQQLHAQIVPALLHSVEPLPRNAGGWICRREDALQAHTAIDSGSHGIWLKPLVPPDTTCNPDLLMSLLKVIPGSSRVPVFMCVRSYQAWLESILEDLGAEAGPRQAIMVKRLAVMVKDQQSIQVLEKSMANIKPAAPISQINKTSASEPAE